MIELGGTPHMIDKLIFFFFRRPVLRRKGVFIHRTAYCSPDADLEGNNKIGAYSNLHRVRLGRGSYIGSHCSLQNISIGRFSCIGPHVQTIIGAHPTQFASLHPAFFSPRQQAGFTFVSRERFSEFGRDATERDLLICVGSDVWLGHGVRILQGVQIHHGAIVAAGALVTKDVPPYAIVAGVPARPIKYRFTEDVIRRLLAISWWEREFSEIRHHAEKFTDPLKVLSVFEGPAHE